MYVRRNPGDIYDELHNIEQFFASLSVTPLSDSAIKQAIRHGRGSPLSSMSSFVRVRKVPLVIESSLMQSINPGYNALYLGAFVYLPEVMFKFLIGFLSRVVICAQDTWNYLEANVLGGRAAGGAHIFNVATGKSTIVIVPHEVQFRARHRGGGFSGGPDGVPCWFPLCHEIGHAFQFFTRSEDRQLLHQHALAAGFHEADDAGRGAYSPDVEHAYGAWVEAFADIFGFFYTNDPVGLRGKENKALDLIVRRLHNAAKGAQSVQEWLTKLS